MPSAGEPDFRYLAYGLRLASHIPISGLEPAPFEGFPDCELVCAPVAPASADAVTIDTDDETGVRVTRDASQRGRVTFEYADGTRFLVEDAGRRITTSWTTTPEDMATYLLGPVLAFVVRSRGQLALHASAVSMRGRAVVITAASTGGKSTTAAALVRRGAAMLTDDLAVIEWRGDVPFVRSGYPRLRVWDDSAAAMFGSADAVPLLTPTWSKRYVDARHAFAREAAPVGAIVVIAGRDAMPTRIRELTGHEAAIALLARTSVPLLLEPSQRAGELGEVARLAAAVPVFEVMARSDLGALDALAQEIEQRVATVVA